MIKKCNCTHAYQDKIYGKKQRVFNETKQGARGATGSYRCTVCGREVD